MADVLLARIVASHALAFHAQDERGRRIGDEQFVEIDGSLLVALGWRRKNQRTTRSSNSGIGFRRRGN